MFANALDTRLAATLASNTGYEISSDRHAAPSRIAPARPRGSFFPMISDSIISEHTFACKGLVRDVGTNTDPAGFAMRSTPRQAGSWNGHGINVYLATLQQLKHSSNLIPAAEEIVDPLDRLWSHVFE